jgi:sulfate permease, SulP family
VVLRFDASLVFINSAFFEQAIMKAIAPFPKEKAVLVVGNGINQFDATGEEKLRALAPDLGRAGITLMLLGLKKPVRETLTRAGLDKALGRENLFPNKDLALQSLAEHYDAAAGGAQDYPSSPSSGSQPRVLARSVAIS